MSQTFSLVCHETKRRCWVGQGWGKMDSFYSSDPETMESLGKFLREHEGRPLVLLCNDTNDAIAEYEDESPPINDDIGDLAFPKLGHRRSIAVSRMAMNPTSDKAKT